MGAHTTEMKGQGRARQMSCTKMHKANLRSQLSIFYMGSFSRACPRLTHPNDFTWMPSPDPPEWVDMDTLKWPAWMSFMGTHMTITKGQGRVGQTSCTNMHKTNLWSQLSIFYMGSFTRAHACLTRPNEFTQMPSLDPPEWVYMDALTQPAQTTHLNEFTQMPSNGSPEWVYMGTHMTETVRTCGSCDGQDTHLVQRGEMCLRQTSEHVIMHVEEPWLGKFILWGWVGKSPTL